MIEGVLFFVNLGPWIISSSFACACLAAVMRSVWMAVW